MIVQGHNTPAHPTNGGHPSPHPTAPAHHQKPSKPAAPAAPTKRSKPAAPTKPQHHKPTPPGKKTAAIWELELDELPIPIVGLKQAGYIN